MQAPGFAVRSRQGSTPRPAPYANQWPNRPEDHFSELKRISANRLDQLSDFSAVRFRCSLLAAATKSIARWAETGLSLRYEEGSALAYGCLRCTHVSDSPASPRRAHVSWHGADCFTRRNWGGLQVWLSSGDGAFQNLVTQIAIRLVERPTLLQSICIG